MRRALFALHLNIYKEYLQRSVSKVGNKTIEIQTKGTSQTTNIFSGYNQDHEQNRQ